jgi:hypothetical protein
VIANSGWKIREIWLGARAARPHLSESGFTGF